MRVIFTLCLILLAAPLAAGQQSRICKGKFSFQLPDGATGCVLGTGTGNVTKSRMIVDTGLTITENRFEAVGAALAMFGEVAQDRIQSGRRYRAICKTIMPVISEAYEKGSYRNIIIELHWPEHREELEKADWDVQKLQSAFLNPSCRAVRYWSKPRG